MIPSKNELTDVCQRVTSLVMGKKCEFIIVSPGLADALSPILYRAQLRGKCDEGVGSWAWISQ